jgi:hypothetical protein
MGKPSTVAAYRTLGAFFRPVRPPDSDRPALPTVAALDESFRGKLAPKDYPCLYCPKVCTSPQALATHMAMKHANLVVASRQLGASCALLPVCTGEEAAAIQVEINASRDTIDDLMTDLVVDELLEDVVKDAATDQHAEGAGPQKGAAKRAGHDVATKVRIAPSMRVAPLQRRDLSRFPALQVKAAEYAIAARLRGKSLRDSARHLDVNYYNLLKWVRDVERLREALKLARDSRSLGKRRRASRLREPSTAGKYPDVEEAVYALILERRQAGLKVRVQTRPPYVPWSWTAAERLALVQVRRGCIRAFAMYYAEKLGINPPAGGAPPPTPLVAAAALEVRVGAVVTRVAVDEFVEMQRSLLTAEWPAYLPFPDVVDDEVCVVAYHGRTWPLSTPLGECLKEIADGLMALDPDIVVAPVGGAPVTAAAAPTVGKALVEFTASDGWITRFLKRHCLVLRRRTNNHRLTRLERVPYVLR